jgi:protein O-GlcNAc transferase
MAASGEDLHQCKANVLALIGQQRLSDALDLCRHICKLEDNAENWFMLGSVAGQVGLPDEGVDSFNRALRLQPSMHGAWYSKGALYQDQGDAGQAEACYREALRLEPEYIPASINLGNLLFSRGNVEEAESCYRQVLVLQPEAVNALANLGKLLQSRGWFSQAEKYFRKAISIQPELPDHYNELGLSLNGQGLPVEAADAFRQAIGLQNDFHEASSNLLLTMNYSSDFTAEQVMSEHKSWGAAVEKRIEPFQDFPNKPDPDRPLRIGFISPDFREHSVASFFEPLLARLDSSAFEVFCYSDVRHPDSITEHLSGFAGHWCPVVEMTDEQVATRIRNDQIDILVDLAGHTARNRLPVFAFRAAPLQVTWLGYPNTTGLTVMDYRFTDAWADPEGATEHYYSESLIRLAGGFLCYRPLMQAPEPAVCPSLEAGYITFGSFNSFVKMTPAVFRTWASILRDVPGSRLLLKNFSLNDPDIRTQCLGTFQSLGIEPDRVELHGILPSRQAHLELYRHIDIALDTFPYNGTTTTCEALWMGIPVITLAGDRHAGRVGVSLMNALGLPQLVATNRNEYCRLASVLASDIDQRRQWRTSLRTRMETSSLCDDAGFARNVEQACRGMWRKWCAAVPLN